MAKFSQQAKTRGRGVIETTVPDLTHEGGTGYARSPKSELFLLGVTNMVGEDTFYESAGTRDARFANLIHTVTKEDADWVGRYLKWLRSDANMRSAPLVGALEYIAAGGTGGRAVLDSVLQRGDEPAEALGYWLQTRGKKIPQPVKRGLADAMVRLGSQTAALKYGAKRDVSLGDVINLTHPNPKDERQAAVFHYLLDRTHGNETPQEILEQIPKIKAAIEYNKSGGTEGRAATWEQASSSGPIDWDKQIRDMGYMALLRNLRNFDQAGISDESVQYVKDFLSDPQKVKYSRQFPYRFYSAYRELGSVRWGETLEKALDLATQNVPEFDGTTAVLVDTSASMRQPVSGKSKASRIEIAGLFGATLARNGADMFHFASTIESVRIQKGTAMLNIMRQLDSVIGRVGHGTNIHHAISQVSHYDRVIILTDDQAHDRKRPEEDKVPFIHTINVGGYRVGSSEAGRKGRYTYGGFTDQVFQAIPLLEAGDTEDWPF